MQHQPDLSYGTPGSGAQPLALVIADPGAARDDARDAATSAGARVVRALDWNEAAEALEDQASARLLMVEAENVDSERLALVLPRIDAAWRATGTEIVVALSPDQIDAVAAALLGVHVTLLCAAGPGERAAAAALALATPRDVVRDTNPNAEAARLRQLNDEVARIAETLARLTRREPAAEALQDRRGGYRAEAARADVRIDAAEVRRTIRGRRLRDQFFGGGLFEDPAWDMLLDLFAAEIEGQRVSVSSLCIAAAVAPTTALRWIGKMTEAALFERHPDPHDRRRAFLALSARARDAMRAYWAAASGQGLPVA